jgi:hypothetical protein
MALTERRVIRPRLPSVAEVDWHACSFDYDRLSDTLYWDFSGESRAAISVPVDDHLLFSVDPETEEVVGFQVDGFLAAAVYAFPPLLDLADRIGLEAAEVAAIRAKLDPDVRSRSTLRTLFRSLTAAEPFIERA